MKLGGMVCTANKFNEEKIILADGRGCIYQFKGVATAFIHSISALSGNSKKTAGDIQHLLESDQCSHKKRSKHTKIGKSSMKILSRR
jgi:hypothetical protein